MILARHLVNLKALIDGYGGEPKIREIEAPGARSSLGRHCYMSDEPTILEAGQGTVDDRSTPDATQPLQHLRIRKGESG
jgi:hypothetical protein